MKLWTLYVRRDWHLWNIYIVNGFKTFSSALVLSFLSPLHKFYIYQFHWIVKNLYVGKWKLTQSPMNLLGLPDLDMVTNHKISTPCSLLMNDNIYMIKRFIKLYQSLKWKPTLSLGEKKVPLSDTNRQAGHEMTWYSFRIVILSNTRKKQDRPL